MKKYEPLGIYLAGLNRWETQISLTFEQVEMIIGSDLPYSALHYRSWWANQEAGSRAPHWRKAGFEVETVDMTQKIVTFCRLSTSTDMLENPTIREIVNAMEEKASDFSFGDFPKIRQQLKGLPWCVTTIFTKKTIFDDYAFHHGGRTELQFNVGYDYFNDEYQQLRHGLAISLKIGQSVPELTQVF